MGFPFIKTKEERLRPTSVAPHAVWGVYHSEDSGNGMFPSTVAPEKLEKKGTV